MKTFILSFILASSLAAAVVRADPIPGTELSEDLWESLNWVQGEIPPEAAAKDLNKTHRLIYLWGTWCSDCRQKLKEDLQSLSSRPELDVVTVSIDKDDKRLREFLKSEGITVAVRHDPSKVLQKSWQVYAVPFWTLWKKSGTGWSLKASDRAVNAANIAEAIGSN